MNDSLPATEWSSSFDGDPPEQLVQPIDATVELVRGLAGSTGSGSMAIPDRPRVVTIFGDRGMGKSTVLRFAMRGLAHNQDCLVLPVIDPEGFALGDSLGSWVLEYLRNELSDAELGYEVSPDASLGSLLDEVARAQVVRWSAVLPGLEQRGLALEEFSRDAAKVPRKSVQLASRWSALLDAVAVARRRPNLQIVVAVDDADLTPELLPSIVNNAQLLGASPRTAIIFATSEPTLRQALAIGLIASHGTVVNTALSHGILTPIDVRSLVGRRLIKSFPRSLRVRLEPLSLEDRLDFTPLGEEYSLRETLKQIPLQADGYQQLSDIFDVRSDAGETLGPSEHTFSLSDNPRDLRQLHEALTRIPPDDPHRAAHALGVILEHGLETVRTELPTSLSQPWRVVDRGGTPQILFDFGELGFGKTVGNGALIYRRSDAPGERPIMAPTLLARTIVEHYSYEPQTVPGDAGQTSQVEHRFGSQLSHLLFLAWESTQTNVAGNSPLENAGVIRGRLSTPGGSVWRDQVRDTSTTSQTEWAYWTVPDWESVSDYYVFNFGWAKLLEVVRHFQVTPDRHELVEYLLLSHIHLVLSTQASRTVPAEILLLTAEDLGAIVSPATWPSTRSTMFSRVSAELTDLTRNARGRSQQREVDFVNWVDALMPRLASRMFTTRELSADLLSLWESVVSPDHREWAVNQIADMAAAHLTFEVADADIELLSRLDEARAAPLQVVRSQVAVAEANERVELLKTLTKSDVAQEIVDALQTTGATRSLLVALLAAGLPADVTARVAELFPPPPGKDGSDPSAVAG